MRVCACTLHCVAANIVIFIIIPDVMSNVVSACTQPQPLVLHNTAECSSA